MRERWLRSLPLTILLFAMLLALAGLAAAQEGPRAHPGPRSPFDDAASPQAKTCAVCTAAFQKCSSTCFGLEDKSGMGSCLTACDNAVAKCSCDPEVTLRSEDLVKWDPTSLTKDACHGNVSCQPNYPSCASWSAYSDCGTPFCGSGAHCGECTCDEIRCFCGPGPAWKTQIERFRVCFDQFGNSCTEWQTLNQSSCDCV